MSDTKHDVNSDPVSDLQISPSSDLEVDSTIQLNNDSNVNSESKRCMEEEFEYLLKQFTEDTQDDNHKNAGTDRLFNAIRTVL